MKSVSGKEFARILERYGWTLLRVNGSHHIYGKPDIPRVFLCRSTATDR